MAPIHQRSTLCVREVPQDSTHFAPFQLMYGRTMRGPIHILWELWTQDIDEHEVRSSYQYVLALRERLNDTLKLAKEDLESSQARQKKYFDKKTKARRFSPGDKVLVLLPTDTNKLLVHWKGPYDIINIAGPNDYKVEINGKEKTMHANLLKKYISSDEETNSRVPKVSSQTRDDLDVPSCVAKAEDYDYEADNGHDQDNLTGDEPASEVLLDLGT